MLIQLIPPNCSRCNAITYEVRGLAQVAATGDYNSLINIPVFNSGLSRSGNSVILGQAYGDPNKPAVLLNDTEIPIASHGFAFTAFDSAPNLSVSVGPGTLFIGGNDGAGFTGEFSMTDKSGKSFNILKFADTTLFGINGSSAVIFYDNTGHTRIGASPGDADQGATLQVNGNLSTADPASGIGNWQLGKVQSAVVVSDLTRYVEVSIDGVIVKLAVVN